MAKKPILVTGAHRSGTTWIGRTISQQSRVKFISEPFNADFPNESLRFVARHSFCDYHSSSQKEEINTCFRNLLCKSLNSAVRESVRTSKNAGVDIRTPVRFCKQLFIELFQVERILVKDPFALLSAGWLHDTFNFDVIVMIRNPLAFVGSLKVAGWNFDFDNLRQQKYLMRGRLKQFSEDIDIMCVEKNKYDIIDRAALLWNVLHFVILEYRSKYPWLFVKHEDIADAPAQGFRHIFDYLGLEINSSILSYIDHYTSESNPIEAETIHYQPRNAKLSLHTWKGRLSEEEIERVIACTSNIASEFYDLSQIRKAPARCLDFFGHDHATQAGQYIYNS